MLKKLALTVPVIIVALLGTTYIALESSDVAIAETVTPVGDSRATHIWYIETSDGFALEAGSPQNPWIQDLRSGSSLHLTINAERKPFNFEFQPSSHPQIREEMRAKYGWRDAWVALLFDVSESQRITVRVAE